MAGSLAEGTIALGVILGPGYLFIRTIARDVPLRSQKELQDLIEMLIVGVLVGFLSVFVMLGVHEVVAEIDLIRTVFQGESDYFESNPGWALLTVSMFLALTYVFSYSAAISFRAMKVRAMKKPGKKMTFGTVWQGLLADGDNIVAVHSTSGKVFVGEVLAYTRTSNADRELALGGEHLHFFEAETPDKKEFLEGSRIVIRENQIEFVRLFETQSENAE